jgi:hypothetical protein
MSHKRDIRILCDAYYDGCQCGAFESIGDVSGPREARTYLPPGWTYVKHTRGMLDVCPACATALGHTSEQGWFAPGELKERIDGGISLDKQTLPLAYRPKLEDNAS